MNITPDEMFYAIKMYAVGQLEITGNPKINIIVSNDIEEGESLTEKDIYKVEITVDEVSTKMNKEHDGLGKYIASKKLLENPVEPVVMCAFAALYQKRYGSQLVSKVRAVLLPYSDDDDVFSLKAAAERYFSKHSTIKDEVKDLDLVGWDYSIEQKNT